MTLTQPTAFAQGSEQVEATDPPVVVTPSVVVSGKFTDNIDLSRINKRSAFSTEVKPGVKVVINSPRVKTYLDYAHTHTTYASSVLPSHSQNALNAFGSVQVLENLAFVDFSGSISQQTVSAFGVQSPVSTAVNPNLAEVSSYFVSPYLRYQLGQWAEFEAKISFKVTDSSSDVVSGSTLRDSFIKASSGKSLKDWAWIAEIGRQSASYSQGRATESDSINVGLILRVSPQLQLLAKLGTENSNYTTLDKQRYATHTLAVKWLPSDLTSFSLTRSQQSFGQAYTLLLTHRSGRTVWKLSDSKERSIAANPASMGTMYDLLFNQFAATEPDPQARATMVENYLQTNGISATASPISGFLTSALAVQRQQSLSFALLGVRDTITFIASRSESSRLDTLSDSVDDLVHFGSIRQQGFSVQLAHRLTPDYALGVLLSQQQTSSSGDAQTTQLRSLDVILSGKVGRRSSVSLGARRTLMDGDTESYVENAVSGNFNVRF